MAQLLPQRCCRNPRRRVPANVSAAGAALTTTQLFDSIAIRIDGPRAWTEHLAIDWVFTDVGHTYRTELSNGVLIQDVDPTSGNADLTLTLTKKQLLGLLSGGNLDQVDHTGDPATVAKLLELVDPLTEDFAIVTPQV